MDNTTSDSEKRDKQMANRRRRRRNRMRIAGGEEPLLDREAFDIGWTGNKDGKSFFDQAAVPECMRK